MQSESVMQSESCSVSTSVTLLEHMVVLRAAVSAVTAEALSHVSKQEHRI